MPTITRQERERLVLDLYNQGKTIREIAKEVRMSFRDIGAILNKAVGEKTEGSKEVIKQQDNNDIDKNQQQYLSLSTQAYKHFSNGKTPLEVAIELDLRESEVTKFYKEYWKLKQLHDLYMVYEETNGDIEPFLKLYRLSKVKGMGVKQVVDTLAIANNDLPAIEKRFKRLRNDISMLQFQKRIDERNLYQLNNQIASTRNALTSYRISCIGERRKIEHIHNEQIRIENLVSIFKSNNEEYLKIKQTVEEKVKSVLTDSKLLLQLALASVIEALRRNPETCNSVLYNISNNTTSASYGSNYLSLMSPGRKQQQQPFAYISDDSYTALILEETEKLYNQLTTELTNRIIAAAASIKASSLPSPSANTNKQKLDHKNDNTYQTEEFRYNNNQPEIYDNDQEQSNE
jgi:hypothetical protein